MFDIDSTAAGILDKLEQAGFSAYIVGGAVRDIIMGGTPHDYDIATSALPQYTKALFRHTVDTGIKHGTVTVVENRCGYEVTTYRTENGYADNRHPDAVNFVRDIDEDLKRRDFTINAIAYSPKRGIRDLFGGREDIKNKIIRTVGEPEERFKEDALRMLRAVRFSAQLGFEIEAATQKAIRKCAVLIKSVSRERILEELNKILISKNPMRFRLLYELGLLSHLMPEIAKCFETPQKNKYHIYNVGDHIMHAVNNIAAEPVLRWAALMHDVGKPCCLSRDSNGVIHFYGHHKESVRIADKILHDLRMDSASIKSILTLVEYHDVRIDASQSHVKRMMSRLGADMFLKLLTLQEADNRAKNPDYIPDKISRIERVKNIYNEIIAEGQPYQLSDMVVNGRDLLKCGYKAGREIGDALRQLLDEVIINPELNNRKYLLERAREIKKNNFRRRKF